MAKIICSKCIVEPFVSKEAIALSVLGTCSYCGKKRRCVSFLWLARFVDEVYRRNVRLREAELPYADSPVDMIGTLLACEENVAADLAKMLHKEEQHAIFSGGASPAYSPTMAYELVDPPNLLGETWSSFVESVKHRSRFFCGDSIAVLHDLFAGISQLPHFGEKAPIRYIGPQSEERFVYRARRANGKDERIAMCLAPAQQLGPPPKDVASAGRMNAIGISTFYGAFDPKTCVAELRLGIGECAVCCKFEVVRKVRVLDLTVLKKLYIRTGRFDPAYEANSVRLAFLQDFDAAISKPVRAGAELEYLPTQALAEYLAFHYQPRIDAVIYSSTQAGNDAQNIVFLNHAATVSGGGRQPKPRYEEDWDDIGYLIWDRAGMRRRKAKAEPMFRFAGSTDDALKRHRPTLRAIKDGISVHRVISADQEITTDASIRAKEAEVLRNDDF